MTIIKVKDVTPVMGILNAPLRLGSGALAAWSAVPERNQPFTEAWGVAVVSQAPAGYDCQLFVWVRGAYKNLGLSGKLLEEALSELRKASLAGTILVDLGEEELGNPSYQQRKAAWLRLYGQRGFVREVFERLPRQSSPLRLKLSQKASTKRA